MAQIPNFPSNNQDQPQRPPAEPITQARLGSRKSGMAQNLQRVGNGLFETIVIPMLKDLAMSFVSSGARMIIYDEDNQRGGYQGGRVQPVVRRVQSTPYNSPYRPQRGPRSYAPAPQERPAEMFEDAVFQSIDHAHQVLGKMQERIHTYGLVTVGDLYTMCSLPTNITHERWGWTDLRGVRIETINAGHIIGLPDPEFFATG